MTASVVLESPIVRGTALSHPHCSPFPFLAAAENRINPCYFTLTLFWPRHNCWKQPDGIRDIIFTPWQRLNYQTYRMPAGLVGVGSEQSSQTLTMFLWRDSSSLHSMGNWQSHSAFCMNCSDILFMQSILRLVVSFESKPGQLFTWMHISRCSFELGQVDSTAGVSTDQSASFSFPSVSFSSQIFSTISLPSWSRGCKFCSERCKIPPDMPEG